MAVQSLFILQFNGRSLSFSTTFTGAVSAGPTAIAWKSTSFTPDIELGRWAADTSVRAFQGYEIREVRLNASEPTPEPVPIPRRPRFEPPRHGVIGRAEHTAVPAPEGYHVNVVATPGGLRYQATDGAWNSRLCVNIGAALCEAWGRVGEQREAA